jgi:hypothetical protein
MRKIIFAIEILFLFLFSSICLPSLQIEKQTNEDQISSTLSSSSYNAAVIVGAGTNQGEWKWISETAEQFYNAINTNYWNDISLYTSEAATKHSITLKIQEICDTQELHENNVLLFYYCGHSGRDNSGSYITTSYCDSNNYEKTYDMTLLGYLDQVDTSKTKLVLIFETCYAGRLDRPLKNQFLSNNFLQRINRLIYPVLSLFDKNREISEFVLSDFKEQEDLPEDEDSDYDGIFGNFAKQGRVVLSSCRESQQSWRYNETKNMGAFTYFLTEGLEKHNFVEDIFYYARDRTRDHVREYWRAFQKPQIYDYDKSIDVRIK